MNQKVLILRKKKCLWWRLDLGIMGAHTIRGDARSEHLVVVTFLIAGIAIMKLRILWKPILLIVMISHAMKLKRFAKYLNFFNFWYALIRLLTCFCLCGCQFESFFFFSFGFFFFASFCTFLYLETLVDFVIDMNLWILCSEDTDMEKETG